LGILSSSTISRWPNQPILCPFIYFTIFSPLLISSSSRFVLLFHSPSSYLNPYILLNIFLSKISRALVNSQIDAQNSYLFIYNTFIKILYMFRALTCSSSGGLVHQVWN
jgi:hypothetical protein